MAALDDPATVSESASRWPTEGSTASPCCGCGVRGEDDAAEPHGERHQSSEGLEQFTMSRRSSWIRITSKGRCLAFPQTLYFNNNDVSDVEQFVSDVAVPCSRVLVHDAKSVLSRVFHCH